MYGSQSHSSAHSGTSSTSYMSENSDHSTGSSQSLEIYKAPPNHHLKQHRSHPNKNRNRNKNNQKRGHSVKSHSTHNSSSNHPDDEHEIEDHSKSIVIHGSNELNASHNLNRANQHYKTSMNSNRTSSDASLSMNHNEHEPQSHRSSNSHHKSRKSNNSHSLKQSRTSNTATAKDEQKSQKSQKSQNKRNKQYSYTSSHSNQSHISAKKEQMNEQKQKSKAKNKLKASKLDEFSKQNRKYLCLNDDDARSMLSEQSIEFLGHVHDNQISIKAVPKKTYNNMNNTNNIKQQYIDENHSDSEEQNYEYWKPQNQRKESTHSIGTTNSLNSINTNTVSRLKNDNSNPSSPSATTNSHSSSPRSHSHSHSPSHSHSESHSNSHENHYSNRSITELTTSDHLNIEVIHPQQNNDHQTRALNIITADDPTNDSNNKSKPKLKNNISDTTDQSYIDSEQGTVESSVLSPLSDVLNPVLSPAQMYGNVHQSKSHYNGQYIYNHHSKNHLLSQPMDRVQIRSHTIQKKPRHHHHAHKASHDDADTVSVVSTHSIETAASLNSISTSATSNKFYKPLLKQNQVSNKSLSQQDYEREQLRHKIQEQIALQKEYDEARQLHEDAMETESYMSAIYTEETRSVYTEDQHRRHKSTDTMTTKDYEPSIFTDIDYDIDYANVGIKDIVWTQKLKYLKNRLIFLEKEIADLPTEHKRLDKLMLYSSLEFLSINPDEKKANDRLVEWWDLHKYSWLDKHDPNKEDTLLSQNWNEIGIPLTRDPGSTPTHHNKTLFEDIYDNLKRTEWIDPLSHNDDKKANDDDNDDKDDDNKSMIPSTILFDQSKYKDYDRELRSYLIDATDFLNFLHRQTTGNLVRSKSGLVGYVNVSVEDKIAECTPWRLHRIFQTSAYNRLNHDDNLKLLAKNDALTRSTDTKTDQIEDYRIQIAKLNEKLQEEQVAQSQMREQYEMRLDGLLREQQKNPSSGKSSKRGNSAVTKRHKHSKQYLGEHHGHRGISDNSQDSHEISPSPSGHSHVFDPTRNSRSVPPHDDNDAYLHSTSVSPHYNGNDHQYTQNQRERERIQYTQNQRDRSKQSSRNSNNRDRDRQQHYDNHNGYHEAQRFSPMMQSKSHHSSSSHSQHKRHYTQPQHAVAQKKKRKNRARVNDRENDNNNNNNNNNNNIVIYTGNDPHHHHYQQNHPHYDDDTHSEEPMEEHYTHPASDNDHDTYQHRKHDSLSDTGYDMNPYDERYQNDHEHYDDRYQKRNKRTKRAPSVRSKTISPMKQKPKPKPKQIRAKPKTKTKTKSKVKVKVKTKSKAKIMESKPSPVPQQMTLNSKQRRDMAINRSKRALATWKLYVDRYEYIKKRYPTQIADRNQAWLQWTKMLDERDKNPNKSLTEPELWSYIDFARMSISRYANWIWWPERPDLIQLNPLNLKTINKAKKSKSSNGSVHDDNRTYINDKQYYDHQLNLIFTKKFAIVMDFNLFLFETYANPANIQETLAYEHSLLSLASSTNVVVSKKNSKDFYLNTSGKNEYRYLQFRCDGKNDDDDDAQRNEWMEELDYQIHIVHDLLSIPNIKLKIADPNATVWLPTPCVPNKKIPKSKPSTPSTQKTGQV